MGISLGLPDVYPIFHPIIPGRSRGLCAEFSLFLHTLGERRVLRASYPGSSPITEPRALLPDTEYNECSTWYTVGMRGTPWYTQGGIVGYIYRVYTSLLPGWCIQGGILPTTRVVYTGHLPTTRVGIYRVSSLLPGCIYQGVPYPPVLYPGVPYPPVLYPGCT